MSIISLQESLDFLDVGTGYFEITAENDILNMTSDRGGPVNIDIPDLTYQGDDLATALQTAMNTNDILTGGVITFAVSYNSATFKFTIDSGEGHTITIDVSKSDAALTFGFTSNPTVAQSITSDQAATEDPTDIVDSINDGVDKWVKEYCGRDFEQTTYTKKLYDGEDSPYLFLKQYPIISIERLALGKINGIKVHNSSSDATRAVVTVNTSGLVLTITGGVNAGSDTLLFTDYATLTLLVAAIVALGKNWTASVVNSSYAGHASSELLPRYGAYCGITGGATWAYLEMPDEPLTDIKVYPDEGVVYYSGGFSEGKDNIVVDYVAGFSIIPEDLKLATKILCKFIYQKRDEESFGLEQGSLGYVKRVFEKELPSQVEEILSRYKKLEV